MKVNIVLGTLALAMALSAGDAAFAEGNDADRLLRQYDKDGDGFISRREADHFRGGRFREMDTNGDGAVSREEMLERFQRSIEREFEMRFERLDRNRDGRIDEDEYGPRDENRFDRLDANGDGRISPDELKKARRRKK